MDSTKAIARAIILTATSFVALAGLALPASAHTDDCDCDHGTPSKEMTDQNAPKVIDAGDTGRTAAGTVGNVF